MLVSIDSVKELADKALEKVGLDVESRGIVVDTILFANQRGVATHGIGRLPIYINKIQSGHLNPRNDVNTLMSFGGLALLDAQNSMGQIAAYRATKIAISEAKENGISAVGVRNSNNFGTAGYFGDMAAREGMAAIIYANSAPAIAPTGGSKQIFGTNPICYAFPCGEGKDPILLDMATTVAARGKIRLAAKNGEKIPLDWAIGPDGTPTDDPNKALVGSLLPIGGYKGYGLSLFVDLFAGLLTGSAHGGDVKNLGNLDEDSGNGHLIICIDTRKFWDKDRLENEINAFRRKVKECGAEGKVFLPGEIEYIKRKRYREYIELSEKQMKEINQAVKRIGIDIQLQSISGGNIE